jgi:hypothetical protein
MHPKSEHIEDGADPATIKLDDVEVERGEPNGIKDIWQLIDPVWKYSQEELVEMMCTRVVFQNGDFTHTPTCKRRA